MATIDETLGSQAGYPAQHVATAMSLQRDLDFSAVNDGSGASSGDDVDFLQVPDNTLVLGHRIETATAEGSTCTVDLGDTGNNSRYVSGHDANSAGNENGGSTTHYYGSADTARIHVNNDVNSAVLKATLMMVDMKPVRHASVP